MSGIYAVTRQALVSGGFNWAAGSFQLCMVGAGYTPDYENHAALSAIPSAQRVAALVALANLRTVNGYCGADNLIFTTLTTTAPVAGLAIVQVVGGNPEVYPLVCFIDQGIGFGQGDTGLPAAVIFDARGIFRP